MFPVENSVSRFKPAMKLLFSMETRMQSSLSIASVFIGGRTLTCGLFVLNFCSFQELVFVNVVGKGIVYSISAGGSSQPVASAARPPTNVAQTSLIPFGPPLYTPLNQAPNSVISLANSEGNSSCKIGMTGHTWTPPHFCSIHVVHIIQSPAHMLVPLQCKLLMLPSSRIVPEPP